MLDSLHCFFLLSNPFSYFSLSLSPKSLYRQLAFFIYSSPFFLLFLPSPLSIFFSFDLYLSLMSSSTQHIFFFVSLLISFITVFSTHSYFFPLLLSLYSLFFLFLLSSYYLCKRFRCVQTFSSFYLYHPFHFFPSLSISSHSPLLSNSHLSFLYL